MTIRASLKIFITLTVLAAALEALEFLIMVFRFTPELFEEFDSYSIVVSRLMSIIIERVDRISRKKKNDKKYPGIDILKAI